MTAPADGGGVPSRDRATGSVVGVGLGGRSVGMGEAAEASGAGEAVVTGERIGIAEAGREDTCAGPVTANGVPQLIKNETIKRTIRDIKIFLMVKFSRFGGMPLIESSCHLKGLGIAVSFGVNHLYFTKIPKIIHRIWINYSPLIRIRRVEGHL
jgi:hypothetical protein